MQFILGGILARPLLGAWFRLLGMLVIIDNGAIIANNIKVDDGVHICLKLIIAEVVDSGMSNRMDMGSFIFEKKLIARILQDIVGLL